MSACPVGSSPLIGAVAESACGGEFNANLITESGSASGQCNSSGQCEFLCQFEVPCSCGVDTITKDAIVCSRCADQSCGDGRCEGTERAVCTAGQEGCFPCLEDCGGATCGDGDCTGTENPETCPTDCAKECTPNATDCIGNLVRKCSADGRSSLTIDCGPSSMVCVGGACVPAGCGNTVCEGPGETPASCPEDCSSLCEPGARTCDGLTLVSCSANGQEVTRTNCADEGSICAAGACRPSNVCGNQLCEDGEDATSCATDCAIVCGNSRCESGEELSCQQDCTTCGDHVCEANETLTCVQDCPVCGNAACEYAEQETCPNDCTECGDFVCEAGELQTCPQDCGVCVPSSKQCLGTKLRVCVANGTSFDDVECSQFGQICAAGGCVTPDVCGNGACESGEDVACAADCTEVCGNASCGGGEDFGTCAIDCPPICGDGQCNGSERSATCPGDCLATCGNRVCDVTESRESCPSDCGFCGDGKCQDGYESPKLAPPANLESCLVDCVSTECQEDAECNDQVACTTNTCSNGTCVYTAVDATCTQVPYAHKCIKFSGCCPDRDGDGYADQACGGSDCDDDDFETHPGAFEACGAGDRNCNGTHKPALKAPRKVTTSFPMKSELAVARGGGQYLAAWSAIPESATVLQYQLIDAAGAANGSIHEIEGAMSPRITFSPTRGEFAIAYISGETGRINWVDQNGALTHDPAIDIEHFERFPIARGFFWLGGTYFAANAHDHCNLSCGQWGCTCGYTPEPWDVMSEAEGFTTSAMAVGALKIANLAALDSRMGVLVSPSTITKLDPNDPQLVVTVTALGAHLTDDQRLGWDGQYAVIASMDATGVWYERFFLNGIAESAGKVTSKLLAPVDIVTAGSGEAARVAILLADGTANLYLAVRDASGGEALPAGLVAGGTNVQAPHLYWDGTQFTVIWLARSGAIDQVYFTTVTCE